MGETWADMKTKYKETSRGGAGGEYCGVLRRHGQSVPAQAEQMGVNHGSANLRAAQALWHAGLHQNLAHRAYCTQLYSRLVQV